MGAPLARAWSTFGFRWEARRRMSRVGACSTAFALVCVSAQASAAPSARLVYMRDANSASCPDESAVRAAVAARLGYDPFVAYATSTMFAEIWRDGQVYRARIRLVDSKDVTRGARELVQPGERCSDIVDTMALTMSIAIDPLSLATPPTPRLQPEPSKPADPEPTGELPQPIVQNQERMPADTRPPRTPEPDPVDTSAVHLEGAVGPTAWIGSAPDPTLGIIANGLVRWRDVSALVEGRADLPASRALPEATARTSLIVGTLGACGHASAFFACATSSLGGLHAEARGITAPRDSTTLHAAAGGRAGLVLALSTRLSVRAQIDGVFVLTPHRLAVDGQTVYTLPSVAAGTAILAAWRFF